MRDWDPARQIGAGFFPADTRHVWRRSRHNMRNPRPVLTSIIDSYGNIGRRNVEHSAGFVACCRFRIAGASIVLAAHLGLQGTRPVHDPEGGHEFGQGTVRPAVDGRNAIRIRSGAVLDSGDRLGWAGRAHRAHGCPFPHTDPHAYRRRIAMRRTTKAALTLGVMASMGAALAGVAASPALAKPYPPPSIHLVCGAAANGGTLHGSAMRAAPRRHHRTEQLLRGHHGDQGGRPRRRRTHRHLRADRWQPPARPDHGRAR